LSKTKLISFLATVDAPDISWRRMRGSEGNPGLPGPLCRGILRLELGSPVSFREGDLFCSRPKHQEEDEQDQGQSGQDDCDHLASFLSRRGGVRQALHDVPFGMPPGSCASGWVVPEWPYLIGGKWQKQGFGENFFLTIFSHFGEFLRISVRKKGPSP